MDIIARHTQPADRSFVLVACPDTGIVGSAGLHPVGHSPHRTHGTEGALSARLAFAR